MGSDGARGWLLAWLLAGALALGGCASSDEVVEDTPGEAVGGEAEVSAADDDAMEEDEFFEDDVNDPWERGNRAIFEFNEGFDMVVLGPLADAYLNVIPAGGRQAINNFVTNWSYITVILNQFLQGKVETGFEDAGRMAINTGMSLGFLDIAGPAGLEVHDEDFGQTLAVWGVGDGPFVMLPVLGPSGGRDAPAFVVDIFTSLTFLVDAGIALPVVIVAGIDTRARLEPAIRLRDESALDPYVFTREAYRQRRTNLIYDGDPPIEDEFL